MQGYRTSLSQKKEARSRAARIGGRGVPKGMTGRDKVSPNQRNLRRERDSCPGVS